MKKNNVKTHRRASHDDNTSQHRRASPSVKTPGVASQKYLSIKQQAFLYFLNMVKFLHAGRGFGKSHIIGYSSLEKAKLMPGSLGLLTCKTIKQLKEKTFAVIEDVWKELGMEEGIDYVGFKSKPAHFKSPFRQPKDPDNVIWFSNGCAIQCVGSTQYDAARGGSYDWVEGDEIGFFPKEFFDDIVLPSNRGNEGRFMITMEDFSILTGRDLAWLCELFKCTPTLIIPNPLHHQICLYTSPPRKPENMWIYKFKELAKIDPDFLWVEGNAIDNIEAYGRKNLELQRKTMKARTFKIEILGEEQSVAELLYYFAFAESKHTYIPEKTYTSEQGKLYGLSPGMYNPERSLNTIFDFSGWFNCMLIAQGKGLNEYFNDSLYVKIESNINGLVDLFCERYARHKRKLVNIYGDPRGHDRRPEGKTIYEQITERFQKHGWVVEICVEPGTVSEDHIDRHQIMNEILLETNSSLPVLRFNALTCADPVKAIKLTEVGPDFRKIKKSEKDRDFPQEHAPHFTDCVDYYVYQKHGFRFQYATGTGLDYGLV